LAIIAKIVPPMTTSPACSSRKDVIGAPPIRMARQTIVRLSAKPMMVARSNPLLLRGHETASLRSRGPALASARKRFVVETRGVMAGIPRGAGPCRLARPKKGWSEKVVRARRAHAAVFLEARRHVRDRVARLERRGVRRGAADRSSRPPVP